MSSIKNDKTTYPKWSDFTTENSFELPRMQLLELIEQFQPHLKPTLVKESGQRWTNGCSSFLLPGQYFQ